MLPLPIHLSVYSLIYQVQYYEVWWKTMVNVNLKKNITMQDTLPLIPMKTPLCHYLESFEGKKVLKEI